MSYTLMEGEMDDECIGCGLPISEEDDGFIICDACWRDLLRDEGDLAEDIPE